MQRDSFTSWCRYLYWSDILYQRWLNDQSEQERDTNKADWLMFALAAQWLASLWVVVEGWKQIPLRDPLIDKLLELYPDFCDLLRRFRNGVYHFQSEILDDRLYAFPTRHAETISWAVALFYEFKRYLWEYPDKLVGTDAEKEELRAAMEELIGWLPHDLLHARAHKFRKLQREGQAMVAASYDPSSDHSREFLSASAQTAAVADEIEKSPLLQLLTRLSKQPKS